MSKFILTSLISLLLTACVTHHYPTPPLKISPREMSELQQGKRYFEDGYYKKAMQTLLPLACEGIAEAQYGVGYMYYYGYGVAQDTDVGYFWIKRSADQSYMPAVQALVMIEHQQGKRVKPLHY
ncbi:MAG: hypothetical protein JO149_06235 [Gammaproteobacteria bacterium]|nr:hypothetical protein [Gammaproteobacteria bacterium]